MAQTVNDPLLLEACVRDELNVTAPRYCIALAAVFQISEILVVKTRQNTCPLQIVGLNKMLRGDLLLWTPACPVQFL